jgi:adenylate cyclase
VSSPIAQRRLAAILAADVVGYSRMMAGDEAGTLARLRAARRDVVDPLMAEFKGRVFKVMGDGLLAEFPSAVQALRCAIAIQERLREGDGLQVRIGLHQGDVIAEGGDLLGDGVNVAARLEGLAEPGGICISGRVREDAAGKLSLDVEDLGEPELKNIAQRHRVFRVRLGAAERPALVLPGKPSIAVLPFQNMSGDPEQEYFADGIVEEIITALCRFWQLFVIARNSSFTYKGRAVDVKQIGRELGVRYVLEGSVRRAANRLRITGQLIDAASGAHLWADRFDGALDDIFELQDQVTARVVSAIAPAVQRAEIDRARHKPTENLDAYDCYLHGMGSHVYATDRAQNDAALAMFLRTIELDPNFAAAHAMAAFCYTTRKFSGWRTDLAWESAEATRLARRAVELGKDDPATLACGGMVLAHMGGDLDAGIAFIERAVALNPNMSAAWTWTGWFKIWAGDPDAAVACFERGMRLSPLDPTKPYLRNGMAHALYFARRFDAAADAADLVLRELPNFHDALRIGAVSNAMAGRMEQAAKSMARLRGIDPKLRVGDLREIQGPYRRDEDHALYEEGMRKAGLPE